MALLDIILIILFILAGIKGYFKGFIQEFFSFIAFFIGLLVTVKLTTPIVQGLFKESNYYQVIAIVVFVTLFLITILLINLLGNYLKEAVKITTLGFIDNILGVFVGMLKWMLIISLLLWVFASVGFSLPVSMTEKSVIFPVIERAGPVFFEWLSRVLPFIKDAIDSIDHINGKESYT